MFQKSGLCFSRWKIDSMGWLHNKQGESFAPNTRGNARDRVVAWNLVWGNMKEML